MIEVMIVEDDPMVRDINSKFLKRIEGFRLYKAVSKLKDAKALNGLKKHSFNLKADMKNLKRMMKLSKRI